MTDHRPAPASPFSVVTVGGSLVGLSTAISLAQRGLSVTVLERTDSSGYEGGGGLGVDLALLAEVTGLSDQPPVCQGTDRATCCGERWSRKGTCRPEPSSSRPTNPSREYYSGPYRLVTYLVPGADGSPLPGRRRLNLVWYDPARSERSPVVVYSRAPRYTAPSPPTTFPAVSTMQPL